MRRCVTKYVGWLPVIFCLNMYKVAASEYKFELLNENDGFATSVIFSIVQDKQGFLWFGTGYDGIMRYDGKTLLDINMNPANPILWAIIMRVTLLLIKIIIFGLAAGAAAYYAITNKANNSHSF